MTKTKAQLRAETVERLKDTRMDSGDAVKKIAAAIGSEWNPPSVNHSLGCLKSKLIDLLTDDEPPVVDAVAILRKAAKCTSVNTSVGDVLRYNVPGNGPSAWQTEEDACEALADMIERDYVRRETDVTGTQYASNDGMEQESGVSKTVRNADSYHLDIDSEAVNGKDCESLPDSRDKLEADSQEKPDADLRGMLLLLVDDVAKTAYDQTFDKHLKVDAWWNAFARTLDRQAAITQIEDECACHDCKMEQVEALQEQVYELEAENEQLREKLSRAYDNAHDTLRMM